jgi:hypothetical protein
MPPRTLSARTAHLCQVRNLDGKPLGRVEELVIDAASGRVTTVILAFAGGAAGERFLTLPWEALGLDPSGTGLLLNLPLETLLDMGARGPRQDGAGDGQLAAGAPALF